MKLKSALIFILQLILNFSFAQNSKQKHTILFTDNFNKPLDTGSWIAELETKPCSSVYTRNGKLVLDTKGGLTVWFKKLLTGNIEIIFTRKVLTDTGKNDRLSDLNVFWMATDLQNKNLFTRNGVFEAYDSLSLYYVGMGGNNNTTTRFRKYDGRGNKPLLKEYSDKAHLLQSNRQYHIKLRVVNGVVEFWVDDVCYFSYQDPRPLKQGYFGFRSTSSRQEIDNFKVYKLK